MTTNINTGIEQMLAKKRIDRMAPGIARSVAAAKYRKTYGRKIAKVGNTVRFQRCGSTLTGKVILAYDDWIRVEVAPRERYDMDRFQEVVGGP